jgi:hypothetical protein
MNSIRDLPKFLSVDELADMKRFGLDGESPDWTTTEAFPRLLTAYETLLAENTELRAERDQARQMALQCAETRTLYQEQRDIYRDKLAELVDAEAEDSVGEWKDETRLQDAWEAARCAIKTKP